MPADAVGKGDSMPSPTIASSETLLATAHRVRCLLVSAALAVTACDPPAATAPAVAAPHAEISDATHAGNPLFMFLPPMVASAPAPVGAVFDASASPVVDICTLATPTSCVAGAPIASYSRTAGTGGELVAVDPVSQVYSVKWKTASFSLSAAINYRISVRIGAVTLGYADVDIVSDNAGTKVVDPTRYVAVVNGKTLNIKFAIYQGAADPFPIVIDASALSATTVELPGIASFPAAPARTVSLSPGTYTLRYYAGIGYASADFTVTPAAKVDFDASLDGALSGRGTATLTVNGYAVAIDATALTAPLLDLTSVVSFPTSSPRTVRVLPGPHQLRYYAASQDYPAVGLTITSAGNAEYDPALEGVLTGNGTSSLTVSGRTVSVDATELSAAEWFFWSVATFPNTAPRSVTLLPGVYYFGYNAGSSFTPPGASISIARDGHIGYDLTLEGMLEGRGTSSLVVHGSGIVFDGTALAASELFLLSVVRFPSSPPRTLRLLPGLHYFGYSAGSPFTPPGVPFTVDGSGNVAYAAALDGAISGRGTRAFTAAGRSIQIVIQIVGVASFNLLQIGDYPSGTTLALLPGIHELVAGGRDLTFTIDDVGHLAYDSALFPYLCGAGTATLIIKDVTC
jgi:hypothetical protein